MNLDFPVSNIAGVGPYAQKKLAKLGIKTLEDLLYHLPFRYEDFSRITAIGKLKINEIACIKAKILEIKTSRTWKKRLILTQALVEDKTGAIKVIWFNQPYLVKTIKQGDEVFLAGKVKLGKTGVFLSSPVYEIASEPAMANPVRSFASNGTRHTARIVGIYEETAGLTSRWFRNIFAKILPQIVSQIPDALPQEIIKEHQLIPLSQALWQAHFPDSLAATQKAKARLAFEELFLIELFVLRERIKINQQKAPAVPIKLEEIKKFVKSLPFQLTDSQKKCSWQILRDMEKPRPMSRLLEGDVGSGKTLVALLAALNAIKNGYQVGFMAPTEILAIQHFKTAAVLLKKSKIKIALLTGKKDQIISQKLGYQTGKEFMPETIEISRAKILEKAKKSEIDLLVGTHALIQDKVKFNNLGLVIVDEQHRFGVEQRAKLTAKGGHSKLCEESWLLIPHFLSMTATPIPRTLALTVFGDLDLSLLDQMPLGRKPIITEIVLPTKRKETYDFIKQRIKQGEQCFVICPRIEPASAKATAGEEVLKNAWSDAKAVKEEYEKLAKDVFAEFKVAMVHGKIKTAEKEKTMRSFKNNKINVLVSTSVVEVGVDIPQATVIMIEGAERFGLAQIHQFRGRVGRNDLQSYCFLFTESASKNTRARLSAILKAKNGFELAQKDLEIRGPGSLTGFKQWGLPDLAMANLNNLSLVETTREAAKKILLSDPFLKKYPLLNKKVSQFGRKIHLE